ARDVPLERDRFAVPVAGDHQQAVGTGALEQVAEHHREAPFGRVPALDAGDPAQRVAQPGRQVALAADLGGHPEVVGAVDRLADGTHGWSLEGEAGDVDDGLVADVEAAQTEGLVEPGPVPARAVHRGTPALAGAE